MEHIAIIFTYCSPVVGSIEMEAVSMLANPVEVGLIGQACPQPEVLILEDEACCGGIEESLVVRLTRYSESKWVVRPRESQFRIAGAGIIVAWPRPDGFLNLINLLVLVVDLHVESFLCAIVSCRYTLKAFGGDDDIPV